MIAKRTTTNLPPAICVQPNGGTFALGSSVPMTADACCGSISYQWFKDGSAVMGANTNFLTLSNLNYLNIGHYTLKASNAFGSGISRVATVSDGSVPTVEFIRAPFIDRAAILLRGATGRHYRVEHRATLGPPAPWQLLRDIPSLPNSPYFIPDPAGLTPPKRFYRGERVLQTIAGLVDFENYEEGPIPGGELDVTVNGVPVTFSAPGLAISFDSQEKNHTLRSGNFTDPITVTFGGSYLANFAEIRGIRLIKGDAISPANIVIATATTSSATQHLNGPGISKVIYHNAGLRPGFEIDDFRFEAVR